MPNKVLVVGNFPTTSLTGHQVLTASGYDEATEMLKESSFDVIIMDAVIGTTNGHSFLQKIRDLNETRQKNKLPDLPILVNHSADKVYIVVDGEQRVWNLGPSMCSFGNATFVNTSTPSWKDTVANWLAEPRRLSRKAA
jgi:hypothetical protein